ncbi:MAG: hypothetical protein HY749_17310 [Gammaproteobacteria bacterium]|nr:hypothetical protein [Gammaproteobacteria bacterium]MBI5616420.1 hypothetical protein [Gammaproteobacteria bacterium]
MQSQGKGTSAARATRSLIHCVLGFVAMPWLAPGAAFAQQAPRCAFTDEKLAISVTSEAAADGAGSELQITVSDGERLVARLAATLPAFLEQCWKTDLDGNGHFEIVVASSLAGEGARVNVYAWRETRFEPLKLAPADPALLPPGARAERYYVAERALYGRFRTEPVADSGSPAGRTVTLRYDFAARRWEAAVASPAPAQ